MLTLARRVLRRAADKMGSHERLALVLEIPPASLRAYLDGERAVPDDILLNASDLVREELPDLRRTDPTDDPDVLRGR